MHSQIAIGSVWQTVKSVAEALFDSGFCFETGLRLVFRRRLSDRA